MSSFAQLQFVLRLLPLCVGGIYYSGVGCDQSPLRTIIDREKGIAGFHVAADVDIDLGNDPGDLRTNGNVLRVCFSDARPRDEGLIRWLRSLRYGFGAAARFCWHEMRLPPRSERQRVR